jgi:dienelactone hydrolase
MKRGEMKIRVSLLVVAVMVLSTGLSYAEPPIISKLQFSDNPITVGESFTISFEYEGVVEKFAIENTYETMSGEVKQEVKEFPLRPEEKGKFRGQNSQQWKTENPNVKPYRIFKVWAMGAEGIRSNVLSGEVKVIKPLPGDDVKISMELKTIFGTKQIKLSTTIFKPMGGEKMPLLILNHGTPLGDARKKITPYREQGRTLARKGFSVALPIRRGHGTSEGDYVEYSGDCNNSDYDNVAREAVKDIRAAVDYMKKEPYVDIERKILLVGQSTGGFSSLAYASAYPEEVIAVINFAGGKGRVAPFKVCDEERLVNTMGNFGKTFKGPTLWIYTEQDDYFEPRLSKKMFEAYKSKGGEGKFISLSSEFGHSFFEKATKTWEPVIDEFLKEINSRK